MNIKLWFFCWIFLCLLVRAHCNHPIPIALHSIKMICHMQQQPLRSISHLNGDSSTSSEMYAHCTAQHMYIYSTFQGKTLNNKHTKYPTRKRNEKTATARKKCNMFEGNIIMMHARWTSKCIRILNLNSFSWCCFLSFLLFINSVISLFSV